MLQLTPLALAPLGLSALGVYPLGVTGEVVKRWVPEFDGVSSRGQLSNRAINPEGDNYLEFRSPLNINCTIIAQNISNTATAREFQLWQGASGELNLTFGGSNVVIASSSDGYELGAFYYLSLVGTTATLAKGLPANVIKGKAFVKGAAREPTAVTLIGCRGSGAGVFGTFAQGPQYDVRINGTLWPMSEKGYAIQLPSPSGLGQELITQSVLENPLVKGSQWTYLGVGRWQYLGDGSGELVFLANVNLPDACIIDFEVESYQQVTGSGSMRISPTSSNFFGDRLFNTVGKKRAYYTAKPASVSFTRNNTGEQINCIIKNISFKPLSGRGPNLVLGGDFSNPADWESNNASVTTSSGSANFTDAGIGHRLAQTGAVTDNKIYEVTYTISAMSAGSLRCRLIGTTTVYEGVVRTAPGTYTEIIAVTGPYATTPTNRILLEARAAGTNAVVDNLVVREVTTCNPLTLVNMTNANWQEIEV